MHDNRAPSAGPSSPRIAPVAWESDDPPLNIFLTLAHNRALSKGFRQLGAHLLGAGVLPAREREIVILRVADCGHGDWDEGDQALVALADELCDDNVVSEDTWRALCARWTDAELLELLVLAGFYRLVSGMLNSAGVALEPTTPSWPTGSAPVRLAPREDPRA